MFYVFFPMAARLLRSKRLLGVLLVALAVGGPFARAKAFNHNPVWREYSYLGGMDAIALGCLTAMVLTGKKLLRSWIYVPGFVGDALLIFSLCFSDHANKWGLGRNGLNMTILAVGTCCVIATTTQASWQAPRIFRPLLILGQRSYEIYLTHMFAVMTLFAVFVHFGKPLRGVPILFLTAIVVSGLLGWIAAVCFTKPVNRLIRKRAGLDGSHIGAVLPKIV
jgi:peptidoglycan/LPS O-acetylase OafA/YrhL